MHNLLGPWSESFHLSLPPPPPVLPDCPQVQAVYDYEAQQPDELDLQCGEVIKVYRKMADGMDSLFTADTELIIGLWIGALS